MEFGCVRDKKKTFRGNRERERELIFPPLNVGMVASIKIYQQRYGYDTSGRVLQSHMIRPDQSLLSLSSSL